MACVALVSSGAWRPGAEAAPRPAPVVAGAGRASASGSLLGSPADAVRAALHLAQADAQQREADLPVLRLAALGGGPRVDLVPFDADGTPRHAAMDALAWFFAPLSRRVAAKKAPKQTETEVEALAIDPRLAALLIRISDELGQAPLTIVSGHREPGRGTSRKSFHVRGMAADIAVAGKKPSAIRAAAIRAGAGGVGLYRGFVHVDVRDEPYRWGSGGRSAGRGR